MYPLHLLETFQSGLSDGWVDDEYSEWWLNESRRKSEERGCLGELGELLNTGRSNGRPTEWAVMEIQPFSTFTLHAHAVRRHLKEFIEQSFWL